MSILKSSITALALVVGLSTLANAAPHHRQVQTDTVQPYSYNVGTLPYGEYEGGRVGLGSPGANTRAAEAFQDHFRINY